MVGFSWAMELKVGTQQQQVHTTAAVAVSYPVSSTTPLDKVLEQGAGSQNQPEHIYGAASWTSSSDTIFDMEMSST